MTLLLLFWLTLTFTVTTQNETAAIINDLLEAIRPIANDKDVIILPIESINETIVPIDNETNNDVPETDNGTGDFEDLKYLTGQDMQFRSNKNILRWLPKRKKKSNAKKKQEERIIHKTSQMGEAEHRQRIDYVVSVIKNKIFATSYLYKEIQRIQRDRMVVDDIRRIVLNIEGLPPGRRKRTKASILDCYDIAKSRYVRSKYTIWRKPNE